MSDPLAHVVLVWRDGDGTLTLPESAVAVHASWNPNAEDGGRLDLLTSVREARDFVAARSEDPDELTLVGYGRGAVAAAGLRRYAKRLGIRLGPVVCVAPDWDEPDPFSGQLIDEVPEGVELVDRADEVSAVLLTCWGPR